MIGLLAIGLMGCAGPVRDVPLSDGFPRLIDPRLADCVATETWEDDGRLLSERVYDDAGRLLSWQAFQDGEPTDALGYAWEADRVVVSDTASGPFNTFEHDETVWFDAANQVVRRRVDSEWSEGDSATLEVVDARRTLDEAGLPSRETHDLNLDGSIDWTDRWSWEGTVATVRRNGDRRWEHTFGEALQLELSAYIDADGSVGSETAFEYDPEFPERLVRRGRVVSGEPLPQNLYTWDCP